MPRSFAANRPPNSAVGNDRNDGLSPAKAWQSLDKVANESRNKKVRKNGFLPGDQVLFKRGLLYQSSGYTIVKVAGTAASPVRLGAYGDGAAPRFDSRGPGIYEVNPKVEGTRASVEEVEFREAKRGERDRDGTLPQRHRVARHPL